MAVSLVSALVSHTLASCQNCVGTGNCGDVPDDCKGAVEVHNSVKVDMGSSGRSIGNPSSSLTLTFLHHGVPAWADLPGAELRNPPLEVRGIPTFVPSAVLSGGSEVVFHCPQSSTDVCDAWVFFYSCPQSCNLAFQAGVTGELSVPASGWEHTNCAPFFVTGVPSGFAHQMRSYRKKLQPGASASFTAAVDAEFIAFGLDPEGVDCSKITDGMSCAAAPRNACVWSGPAQECLNTRCRRGGQGPPPPCAECPWQGLVSRPASDGPFR